MAQESLVVEDLTGTAPSIGHVARGWQRWLGGVHPGYAVLLLVLLVFPVISPGPYAVALATQILVFSLFCMSLDLLLGYAGLPSFGHASFLGFGAYFAAIMSAKLDNSNLGVALVGAVILSSVGAALLGVLALRTSGVYFLMLTLAFAQILSAAANSWTPVTGGTNGLPGVKQPELFIPGLRVADGVPFYFLALGTAVVCFFLLHRIVNSPFGRALVGIHENPVRMGALGYNVSLYRLAAFWVAGVFASVAGVMYAYFNHFISPVDVGFIPSGTAVLMVLLGGEGTLIGAAIGTAVYVLIQSVLSSYTEWWQSVLGIVFVVFVLFVRGGVVGLWSQRLAPLRRRWLGQPAREVRDARAQ